MENIIFLLEYAYSHAEQFKGRDEWTILKHLKTAFSDVQSKFILAQIQNIHRYSDKFPTLIAYKGLLSKEVVQQATSELVANHKAAFFRGEYFLDLTFGLGIDTFAFAKKFKQVFATEINTDLYEIGLFNLQQLQITNVQLQNISAKEFLQNNHITFDLVYLDPMRTRGQKKVFHPEHSSPNPIELLPLIKKFAKKVLIKLSPMVEIHEITKWFPDTELIWAITVRNECKEVLCLLNFEHSKQTPQKRTSFYLQNTFHSLDWNHLTHVDLVPPSCSCHHLIENYPYLLLPDVTFQKLHLLEELQHATNGLLTHKHDGILFLKHLPEKVFGKVFQIINIFPFQKSSFKKYLTDNHLQSATLQTYHFPEKAESLRKQWKLHEDPKHYLIFVSSPATGKIVIHAKVL